MALTALPPAPTFQDVVLVDPKKKPGDPGFARFNPIWLNWFLQTIQFLQGIAGGQIAHDLLQGLQGGAPGEYYHLTGAQHSTLATLAGLTGLSVTITTAKLTGLGTNGSMTFTNGLLTAQVAAT